MWILIILIIGGLYLLKQGATWFVSGSSDLARVLKVSELAIGLTVVAVGTSAPELVVNIFASSKGSYDIITGNIIGSNIFNLFVILSIVALIGPIKVQSSTAWREIPFSFGALVIMFLLVNDQLISGKEISRLSRPDAILMLGFFLLFIFYTFKQLKQDPEVSFRENKKGLWKMVLYILAGLVALIIGGKLVLDNSVELATRLGMSEKIIGLTIVAAGTSLPELATSLVAASKRNNDIAVGNIIGSNIFNVLFILPIGSLINPLKYNSSFNIDLGFISAGTMVLFLAMYTGTKKQIDRWEAIILFAGYLVYMYFTIR
jgi:cation:H+ antiporter